MFQVCNFFGIMAFDEKCIDYTRQAWHSLPVILNINQECGSGLMKKSEIIIKKKKYPENLSLP